LALGVPRAPPEISAPRETVCAEDLGSDFQTKIEISAKCL